MPISGFNHFNIMTGDLERSRRFYREVLGLQDGKRPPFRRPGAWMYIGEHAVLHISTGRASTTQQSDAFDHIAFSATDIEGTLARLRRHGVPYKEYPDPEVCQVFFHDPDGVEIELQFTGDDARASLAHGDAAGASGPV
jgi:catechol 2,3-dioxygenase-like lactoylglutathione lyase family enzyme